MSNQAPSFDLDPANLLWLQAQRIAARHPTLSATLNEILTRVRTGDRPDQEQDTREEAVAVISASDPELKGADAAIRELFRESYERSAELLARSSRGEL